MHFQREFSFLYFCGSLLPSCILPIFHADPDPKHWFETVIGSWNVLRLEQIFHHWSIYCMTCLFGMRRFRERGSWVVQNLESGLNHWCCWWQEMRISLFLSCTIEVYCVVFQKCPRMLSHKSIFFFVCRGWNTKDAWKDDGRRFLSESWKSCWAERR